MNLNRPVPGDGVYPKGSVASVLDQVEEMGTSEGMDYVIVNGVPVIAKGEYTGARSGRVLRHLPSR